jgi:hypothetical protein
MHFPNALANILEVNPGDWRPDEPQARYWVNWLGSAERFPASPDNR